MLDDTRGTAWGHRPALDGVRAIAVYLVVLFHAGVSWMQSGFVGVDVFFVLSGFLVTNVVLTEHEQSGRLDLPRFYARRVRRLLPAAVATVVGVAFLSLLTEPKLVRLGFVDDARAALLYVANWHFLGSATDYFADDVQRSPFLHFWSLAIEEQFYIVFPVVLVGLLALRRRRWLALGLGVLFALSLAAQLVVASDDPLAAYYATHTRVYQLFAGALLAVLLRHARPFVDALAPVAAALVATIALAALVVLAACDFSLSPSTRGIAATAAAVALLFGLEGHRAAPVARVLASRTCTYLGRISYGTYLWHWPLIILVRPALDLSPGSMAAIAILGSTALAALSSEVLETPIRRSARLDAWRVPVIVTGLGCSALAAFVVVPQVFERDARPAVHRSSSVAAAAVSTADVAPLLAAPVPASLDTAATELPEGLAYFCAASKPLECVHHTATSSERPDIVLLGDSNAQQLISTFTLLAAEHDFSFAANSRPGCPWQLGLVWDTDNQPLIDQCVRSRIDWYDHTLPALDPDVVVITHVPRDPGSRSAATILPEDPNDQRPLDEIVADATEHTLAMLVERGYKVVLLEPLPYGDSDPNFCLSGAATVGECAYQANTAPFPTEVLYRRLANELPGVYSIDYDAIACPHLPTCIPMLDGELVFRNQFHLSTKWLEDHRAELWDLLAPLIG